LLANGGNGSICHQFHPSHVSMFGRRHPNLFPENSAPAMSRASISTTLPCKLALAFVLARK
jgi:hypothetical protein